MKINNIVIDPNNNPNDNAGKQNSFDVRKKKTLYLIELMISPIEDANAIEEKVKDIYKKIERDFRNDRLLYSTISNKVYEMQDQELDDLQSICEQLVLYAENKGDSSIEKIVLKLTDHVNLALAQERFILDKNQNTLDESKDRIQEFIDKEGELTNKIDNMTTQTISILGIFTAISFVVFGGISSASSILENASKLSMMRLILLASIWSLAICNLVFFLLYFMAKLSKISIKTNPRPGANICRRHPYIVIINFVLSSILVLSLWGCLVEITTGVEWLKAIVNNNKDFLLIGTVVLISAIIILFIIILFKVNDSKDDWNY